MTDTSLTLGDAELIAAYLDRQLDGEEQKEFLERLDQDETLYEVFVETVRFREERSKKGGAEVVEHPSARRRMGWALRSGVAALLALAVVGPFLLQDDVPLSGSGLARELTEDGVLESKLEGRWFDQGWRVTRSLKPIRSEVDSAFRVGVHVVDLEVALRLGRTEDARRILKSIQYELTGVDFSEPLSRAYAEAEALLEDDGSLEDARRAVGDIDSIASDYLDLEYGYVFGKWAEAGKLAARAGNEDLLRSRTFRNVLRDMRAIEWSKKVDEEVEAIAAALGPKDVAPDLEALEDAFTRLINLS